MLRGNTDMGGDYAWLSIQFSEDFFLQLVAFRHESLLK
jgi:hypothetical protein